MTARILGDRWEHVKSLGKGSFGTVHLFRDAMTHGLYAVKFIECTELAKEEAVQKEVLNHCQLSHENIARFKELILCPPYLAIVMEVLLFLSLLRLRVPRPFTRFRYHALSRYVWDLSTLLFLSSPSQSEKSFCVQTPLDMTIVACWFRRVHAQYGNVPSRHEAREPSHKREVKGEHSYSHAVVLYPNCNMIPFLPNVDILFLRCHLVPNKSLRFSTWQTCWLVHQVGTAAYIAPEVITAKQGAKYRGEVSPPKVIDSPKCTPGCSTFACTVRNPSW
eukprot:1187296-Prorocentrum_minimum.AAC.3